MSATGANSTHGRHRVSPLDPREVVAPSDHATFTPLTSTESTAGRLVQILRTKDQSIAAFHDEAAAFAEELDVVRADKAAAVASLQALSRQNKALQSEIEVLRQQAVVLQAQRPTQEDSDLDEVRSAAEVSEKRNGELRELNEKLRADLVTSNMDRRETDARLHAHTLAHEAVVDELQTVRKECDTLRNAKRQLEDEVHTELEKIRRRAEETRDRLESCEMREQAALQNFHDSESRRGELHRELSEARARVLALEDDNTRLADDLEQVKSDHSDLAQRYDERSSTIERLTAELESLQAISSSYQKELYELRRQYTLTADALTEASAAHERTKDQLAAAQDEGEKVADDALVSGKRAVALHETLERLTGELDASLQQRRESDKQLSVLQNDVSSLKRQLDTSEEQNSDLLEEVAEGANLRRTLEAKLRRSAAEREAAYTQCEELQEAMSRARREWDDLLRSQAEASQIMQADSERVVDESSRQAHVLQEEVGHLHRTVEGLEQSLATATASTQAAVRDRDAALERLSEIEAANRSLQADVAAARDEAKDVSELSQQNIVLAQRQKSAERALRDAVEHSKRQRDSQAQQIEALKSECMDLRKRLDRRENEQQRSVQADNALSKALAELKTASSRISSLEQQVAAMKKACDSERAAASTLRVALQERSTDLQQLKLANAQLSETIDSAESALAASRKQLVEGEQKLDRLVHSASRRVMTVLDAIRELSDSCIFPTVARVVSTVDTLRQSLDESEQVAATDWNLAVERSRGLQQCDFVHLSEMCSSALQCDLASALALQTPTMPHAAVTSARGVVRTVVDPKHAAADHAVALCHARLSDDDQRSVLQSKLSATLRSMTDMDEQRSGSDLNVRFLTRPTVASLARSPGVQLPSEPQLEVTGQHDYLVAVVADHVRTLLVEPVEALLTNT